MRPLRSCSDCTRGREGSSARRGTGQAEAQAGRAAGWILQLGGHEFDIILFNIEHQLGCTEGPQGPNKEKT